MKYYFNIIIYLVLPILSFGQVDSTISKIIDSLEFEDQKWRILLRQINNKEIDSLSSEFVGQQIKLTDSLNFIQIHALFNKHGYLGYDKMGLESSHNFWLLVQHADMHPDFQERVLTVMKIEADKDNSSLTDYAYLLDRVKVNTGQAQIYGTQMTLNSAKTSYEPKAVIDPDNLNDRRKQVGLNSIEEYIETMNDRYFGSLQKK